jgi:enoyl-CoA hydratase
MAVELAKLLLGAADSSEIVVLRGAGEDFCVGRETMGKRPPGAPPEALELRRRNDVIFNCYGAFRRCEIPVIGVVRGTRLRLRLRHCRGLRHHPRRR